MTKKKVITFLLLALIFLGLTFIYISLIANHRPYTAFVIRESDFPKEWSHGEVEVAEITTEELNQYPILQNLISGDCTKYDVNWWRCKVDSDKWNRTKNFISTKKNTDVCIKIGEKCYTIDFVTCCTRDIDITDIFVGRCACPPNTPQQELESNEPLMVVVTIQNNQSASTDMLNYMIKIKKSSNVLLETKEMMGYIRGNSSGGISTTATFPGPGEYSLEIQIFEKDKMIAQRSTNITVGTYRKIYNTTPISIEEYEIYSTVIKQNHDSKSMDKFVIRRLTYNDTVYSDATNNISNSLLDNYIDNTENYIGRKLDIDLVKNFKIINSNRSELDTKFSIVQRVFLVSENELNNIFSEFNGWDRFYEIYPNSSGVIEISRVGFNNNYTQALLYYGEQSHYVAGNGYLIFLIKEEGKWIIKEQVMLWIS
ncbi:MAG TPA: hypothetical protein VIO58_13300 [Candidatus Methanoperedens sp.]